MRFLPSRLPSTMKIANLLTKDSLPMLIDWLNALQWIHLSKITSINLTTKTIVSELVRTVIDYLEAIAEKQLETFVSDRLVVSKLPILQKNYFKQNRNKHTDTGQLTCKVEYCMHWRKWIKLENTEKLWLKNCLNMKLTIFLKAHKKIVKMASNYIMA